MFQTDDLRVPDATAVDDKRIRDALSEYARLREERNAANAAVAELEAGRSAAAEADRQRLADALRRGEPDPGDVATKEAEAAIANAQRRAEALTVAAADAGKDLVATVERQKAAWGAKLDAREDAARRALVDAVDAVTAAHGALADVLSLRAWLQAFPGGKWKWSAGFLGRTPGLVGANGSPLITADVLAALRRLADRPEPKAPPEVRPLAAVPEAS